MKFEFNLSVSEIIINYLLMMAVIIGGGFSGQWWLGFLALPLFLRGMVGWCPIKTILKNGKTVTKTIPARQNNHRMAV